MKLLWSDSWDNQKKSSFFSFPMLKRNIFLLGKIRSIATWKYRGLSSLSLFSCHVYFIIYQWNCDSALIRDRFFRSCMSLISLKTSLSFKRKYYMFIIIIYRATRWGEYTRIKSMHRMRLLSTHIIGFHRGRSSLRIAFRENYVGFTRLPLVC
jgi:hypothetical protein